nr:MAG TPA: hypothetical protein [Crassvirales sp.]
MDTAQIIGLVLGSNLVNSIVTWILSRRKNEAEVNKTNAEVDSTQLDNLTKQLDFYKKLVTDYKHQLEEYIQISEENRLELLRLRRVVGNIVVDACLAKGCSKRVYLDDKTIEELLGGTKEEIKSKLDNNEKADKL